MAQRLYAVKSPEGKYCYVRESKKQCYTDFVNDLRFAGGDLADIGYKVVKIKIVEVK